MKLTRRAEESISIAFLDVITCGIGAIILLLMISKPPPTLAPEPLDDPRVTQISQLQRQLFGLQDERSKAEAELAVTTPQLRAQQDEAKRLRAALLAAQMSARGGEQAAAKDAEELGRLRIAQQTLSEEMKRLRARQQRNQPALVGGIPIDSDYLIFIIDTSGSMKSHAWDKLKRQMQDTLAVYPHIKGLQVLSDGGLYMLEGTAQQWLPDTAAQRAQIIAALDSWEAPSNSNPRDGIYKAIEDFYRPDRKISLFIFGDEFANDTIGDVVNKVSRINPPDTSGHPQVRIHAIGFPASFGNKSKLYQESAVRFAALMRRLTQANGGTFVGLNAYR